MDEVIQPAEPAPKSSPVRERILDAARRLIDSAGTSVSMAQIAEQAGVSRQTVYLQFGSRAGLFFELANFIGSMEPAGAAMLRSVAAQSDLGAFEGFFRHWIRLCLVVARPYRALWMDAETDPELMAGMRQSDEGFRKNFHKVIFEKLHLAGHLRPIWTAEEAAQAAWATTMYGVFVTHLRNMSGWSDKEIEERGMKVLRATFLTDAAAEEAQKIISPIAK